MQFIESIYLLDSIYDVRLASFCFTDEAGLITKYAFYEPLIVGYSLL